MNDKITAIVLTESDYRENDVLLKILSKEHGFLSLIAKGSKKMTAKNKVFPLSLCEFTIDYNEQKTLFAMHQKKLLESYFEEDLMLLSFKNILIQATIRSSDAVSENLFEDLYYALSHIGKEEYYLYGTFFFSRLCKHMGITPYVDGCVVCDRKEIIALSNSDGGFVCVNHALKSSTSDIAHLKKFRLINKASYEHMEILKQQEYDFKDFTMMVDFFKENSGIYLKTYDFFLTIKG